MVDRCAALALPGAELPAQWPVPELKVPALRSPPGEAARLDGEAGRSWRSRPAPSDRRNAGRARPMPRSPAPPGRRFRGLGAGRSGREAAGAEIVGDRPRPAISPARPARRHPGAGVRPPRCPTIPASSTSPRRWARPRSEFSAHQPVALGAAQSAAATMETKSELPCRPCHKPVCRLGHHRCMREIAPERSSPRPAARSRRSRLSVKARRRITWYSPNRRQG